MVPRSNKQIKLTFNKKPGFPLVVEINKKGLLKGANKMPNEIGINNENNDTNNVHDAGATEDYEREVTEAKVLIDRALFLADSNTSALLQRRALTQHSSLRVHDAKRMVMKKDGAKAREEVETVLRLRGAIDDSVVFRASVVLADVMMIEEKYEEAEEMLSGLLGASNLRTSYTQSNQAKKLLEKVQKILAREAESLTR